jgi:hypothetical protein
MAFGFGEDGAMGSTAFRGMEIEAKNESKNISQNDFVYGCIYLALALLTHYMPPAKAGAVLEKHIVQAVKLFERRRERRNAENGRR